MMTALIYVLHNGGDPNTVVGENDETVLMLAARMRPPPFVRILLAHGADYTRTDKVLYLFLFLSLNEYLKVLLIHSTRP
jgi:ankyrin repeat protein